MIVRLVRLPAVLFFGLTAVAAVIAAPPPARAQDPTTAPDRSWIDLTGRVGLVGPSAFTLDYGPGSIIVEVDDYDARLAEALQLAVGSTVTVSGRIDADPYQRRSIEAARVVVHDTGLTLRSDSRDDEETHALNLSQVDGGRAGPRTAFGPAPSAPVVSSERLAAPAPASVGSAAGASVGSAPVVSSGRLAAPAPGVVTSAPVVSSNRLAAPQSPPSGAAPVVSSTALPPAATAPYLTADDQVTVTGKVGQIVGRTFVLDTGVRQLVVEVDGLGYDPFDWRATRQLRQGDHVTVGGVLEAGLGTDGRLLARSLRYEPGRAPG